jgi:hypothetical protein
VSLDVAVLPRTGTCALTTTGRRSGAHRRGETWYVVVDGRVVLTGDPPVGGTGRPTCRAQPHVVPHLHAPARSVT